MFDGKVLVREDALIFDGKFLLREDSLIFDDKVLLREEHIVALVAKSRAESSVCFWENLLLSPPVRNLMLSDFNLGNMRLILAKYELWNPTIHNVRISVFQNYLKFARKYYCMILAIYSRSRVFPNPSIFGFKFIQRC